MRVRRGLLGWGVFLIVAGSIALAVRAGYLTTDQLRNVGNLWPLILVGIGVGLILSRTRFGFLGAFIVAATFGVIVGGLLAGGLPGFATGACGNEAGAKAFASQDGSFTGSSASVNLELDCGSATVAVASGAAWRIEGEDEDGAGPIVESAGSSLIVRPHNRSGGFDLFGRRESWRVTLPDSVRLDPRLTLNAGSATLNFGAATLGSFGATINAGSANVDLGSVRRIDDLQITMNAGSLNLNLPNLSMAGSIQLNAGSAALCPPEGAGLRLETGESVLASDNFGDYGLIKTGPTWESPGFDRAEVKIVLRTQANAGSFSLKPPGGCAG
jgi:hypothetical protein